MSKLPKLDTTQSVIDWAQGCCEDAQHGTGADAETAAYIADCVKYAEGMRAMVRALEANGAPPGMLYIEPSRIAENERLRQLVEQTVADDDRGPFVNYDVRVFRALLRLALIKGDAK